MERVTISIEIKRGDKSFFHIELNPRVAFQWDAPPGGELILEDGSLLENFVFVTNVSKPYKEQS